MGIIEENAEWGSSVKELKEEEELDYSSDPLAGY